MSAQRPNGSAWGSHTVPTEVDGQPEIADWEFWRQRFHGSLRGSAWEEAGLWALTVLEENVGADWLQRTIRKYQATESEYIVPAILALAPAHTIAYIELLELMLRLQMLHKRPGTERLVAILDGDPVEHQLQHLRLQLEVSALAQMAGGQAAFEQGGAGFKGAVDVALELDRLKLNVETKVILLDQPTREHNDATDRLFGGLRILELRYGVSCAARFTQPLSESTMQEFLAAAEVVAREAKQTSLPRELTALGASVVFYPPDVDAEVALRGAAHTSLLWQRTERVLRKKAWQCRHQDQSWLRVDALDGLWQLTPWAYLDLDEKLRMLVGPARQALCDYGHIEGLVLSSGAARRDGDFLAESVSIAGCHALRRLIEPLRVRETMIIPVRDRATRASKVWRELYDGEPSWLSAALQEHNLPQIEGIFESPS